MTLMNTRRKLYLTAVVLTLAGAMALWAQGTPIIIGDGSLTMESQGVPWPNYSTSGNTKSHPRAGQTVTQQAAGGHGCKGRTTSAAIHRS